MSTAYVGGPQPGSMAPRGGGNAYGGPRGPPPSMARGGGGGGYNRNYY